MRFCGEKNWSIVHPVAGQLPTGVPSVEVSIVLALDDMALGTFAREKNQILGKKDYINTGFIKYRIEATDEIPLSANSVTNTPPPAAAKAAP